MCASQSVFLNLSMHSAEHKCQVFACMLKSAFLLELSRDFKDLTKSVPCG